MVESDLEKAIAVIEAIRLRDADTALRYIAPNFVQHDVRMADGIEGFRQYIMSTITEERELKIVRSLQDGPHVVMQLRAESSCEDMFSIYRFDDGRIVEHWAFYSQCAPPNKSGHTQLDGPTKPQHLEDTEKNKIFARRYYETFHLSGDHSQNDDLFTGDLMIRHEPGVRDGLREFLHDVEILMQNRTIDELKLLVGEGDLMFIVAKGTQEKQECVFIDLYRVEVERIVEHWGFSQLVPPRSESRNQNGMF